MYLKHNDPTVTLLNRLSFRYNGRKFQFKTFDPSQRFSFYGNYWDGGSRNEYIIVDLDKQVQCSIPTSHPAFEADTAKALENVHPQAGFCIVKHSIFCGKDMGITFYLHPDNAAKLLPDKPNLTPDEGTVLKFTSGFKNTYGGRKNIRFSEACMKTGITQEQWNFARFNMIQGKLLNKAGSITNKGLNAIEV